MRSPTFNVRAVLITASTEKRPVMVPVEPEPEYWCAPSSVFHVRPLKSIVPATAGNAVTAANNAAAEAVDLRPGVTLIEERDMDVSPCGRLILTTKGRLN